MIPISIRLRPDVMGLPYKEGKPTLTDGLFCYWRQVAIDCCHESIVIGVKEDINLTKIKCFDAFLLGAGSGDLNKIVKIMTLNPVLLINGDKISGFMSIYGHEWAVSEKKWLNA